MSCRAAVFYSREWCWCFLLLSFFLLFFFLLNGYHLYCPVVFCTSSARSYTRSCVDTPFEIKLFTSATPLAVYVPPFTMHVSSLPTYSVLRTSATALAQGCSWENARCRIGQDAPYARAGSDALVLLFDAWTIDISCTLLAYGANTCSQAVSSRDLFYCKPSPSARRCRCPLDALHLVVVVVECCVASWRHPHLPATALHLASTTQYAIYRIAQLAWMNVSILALYKVPHTGRPIASWPLPRRLKTLLDYKGLVFKERLDAQLAARAKAQCTVAPAATINPNAVSVCCSFFIHLISIL